MVEVDGEALQSPALAQPAARTIWVAAHPLSLEDWVAPNSGCYDVNTTSLIRWTTTAADATNSLVYGLLTVYCVHVRASCIILMVTLNRVEFLKMVSS